MNYYSPYTGVSSYSYGSQYPYPVMPQPYPPSQPQPQQQQQPAVQGLNGKIVDSEDVVRATEVPIGGYGIFPKADLSEIFIKSWNNNGTTSVIAYRPVIPEPSTVQKDNGELTNLLLQKIETLENKIDMFLTPQQQSQPQAQTRKQEVVKNGF